MLGIEHYAATLSSKNAQMIGLDLFKRGKQREARIILSSAANNGEKLSQLLIATSYFYDENATDNYRIAYCWFNKNSGDPYAQYYLSLLYNFGHYVEKNTTKARSWQKKSAEQSFPAAQYNEAVIYFNAGDYINAFLWASYAKQNDFSQASELVESINRMLTFNEKVNAKQQFSSTYKMHRWQSSETDELVKLSSKVL